MKKAAFILLLSIAACSMEEMNEPKAKKAVEILIDKIKSGDYKATENYYSFSITESESGEQRTERLEKITDALGEIQAYEFLNASKTMTEDGEEMVLKYKVTCSKLIAEATFGVIIENGDYKVAKQDVTLAK